MENLRGVTFQIRVTDFEKGVQWYGILFNRKPYFIPHEDFAEWELIPDTWVQVAKGSPSVGNGPIRMGVTDIKEERKRLMDKLGIEIEEVNTRESAHVAWLTFEDPDGNLVGLFEDLAKSEKGA